MSVIGKQPLPYGRGSDGGQFLDQSRDRKGAVAASPFDRIATRYDALWTTTPNGRAQRNLVWRHVDALFQTGERIIDIGCGTGEDAAHFVACGVTVYATDASPAMVEIAQARGGFAAAVRSAEELAQIGGTFDGAISNFGALNCVEDLPAVARSLSALVRPGGRVAICLLGRFCAWETLYYTAHLQFRKAFRRSVGHALACPSAGLPGITVHYPTTAEIRAAFAPDFELQHWTGIGLLVPPSYVSLPAPLVSVLAAFDRLLAHLPLFRALADHRLFLLVRK
jgi:ubiquinone/menaquinone biosynthesis C-methylase UbiE